MQLLPHPGSIPLLQTPPARHPGAETQFLRQELPLDTGVQHEQDPAQHLPIRQPAATRAAEPARFDRQQRLDALPQLVRHDPRRPFTTSHIIDNGRAWSPA
jgi:hypothetical protein